MCNRFSEKNIFAIFIVLELNNPEWQSIYITIYSYIIFESDVKSMGGLYLFIYDRVVCTTKEILGMKFITPKNNWIYYQKALRVIPKE